MVFYFLIEIRSGEYNYKIDIWSIGIIVYRMLFGKKVLSKTTPGGVPATFDRNAETFVTDECASFLEKCLKISPAERATADELLSDEWLMIITPMWAEKEKPESYPGLALAPSEETKPALEASHSSEKNPFNLSGLLDSASKALKELNFDGIDDSGLANKIRILIEADRVLSDSRGVDAWSEYLLTKRILNETNALIPQLQSSDRGELKILYFLLFLPSCH